MSEKEKTPDGTDGKPPESDLEKKIREAVENGLKDTNEKLKKLGSDFEELKSGKSPDKKKTDDGKNQKTDESSEKDGGELDKADDKKRSLHANKDFFDYVGDSKKGRRSAVAAGSAALGGGIAAGGLAGVPFLENIPYLSGALSALQSGITGLTAKLGLTTGAAATNPLLASITSTAVGPTAVGAVGVPSALWALGKAKSWVTRTEYPGFTRPIYEALITPAQLAIAPFKYGHKAIMHGPGYIKKKIKDGWSWTKKNPIGFMKQNVWEPLVKPIIKPTVWGIAGAALGTSAALFGGAPVVLPSAALGYGLMNYLSNSGRLGAGKAAPAAAAKH